MIIQVMYMQHVRKSIKEEVVFTTRPCILKLHPLNRVKFNAESEKGRDKRRTSLVDPYLLLDERMNTSLSG